ncbi:MFS transporter [Paracraurococcus ruber]|uniref:MFS transporter n=1 Tax=Paracraurococcus ruber TaxID=77675 RepID=A0ABS1D394_9PROT|nr:MFS transporter [Paracraurococcus ruber]MBK1661021.1 MFS transporter [Paracraurococcus ruber]TDG29331.1 MFS transporter [Paracraurococcus ruber]
MERHYGWVIVAVGALMSCVGMGSMFSLAVFLDPIAAGTGWSRAGLSGSMTVAFLAMGLGAFGWGAVSDRYGPRLVGLAGGLLLGAGLVLASRAESLLAFQLAYGLFLGAAVGAFFAPMMAAASAWFDRQRALAVSLVSAGLGMAPLTVAPFAQWLLSGHDWREAMLVIGLVAWAVLLPAALLLRRAPSMVAGSPAAAAGRDLTARQALGTRQFAVLAATFFACCLAHSGPIFHVVSYAMVCGLSAMTAVSVYSLQGLAGLGGRLLLGVLADRHGAKPVLIGGLLLQALAIGAFLPARSLGEFYGVAAVFGLAYGGVMPLYAVLARDYFGPRIMGTVFGAATMISCLGMAAGPAVGGWIFDRFGSYAGMHLASLAVGLGAVAIAFTFPPLPRLRAPGLRPA